MEQSDESEDDNGNPVYVREKDKDWLHDQKQIKLKQQTYEAER
jgi:hypothetical protein